MLFWIHTSWNGSGGNYHFFKTGVCLPGRERRITLLDTPGHVDFSAEMERTLQVLDCAVLVISAADGGSGTYGDTLETSEAI